nr:hypothetical protein CFP56_70520 [Quercus suber]
MYGKGLQHCFATDEIGSRCMVFSLHGICSSWSSGHGLENHLDIRQPELARGWDRHGKRAIAPVDVPWAMATVLPHLRVPGTIAMMRNSFHVPIPAVP